MKSSILRSKGFLLRVAALTILSIAASNAVAVPTFAPIQSAIVTAGGPGSVSIDNTFNQAGLSANYVPGVTPWQPFVSTTSHTFIFGNFEWFSEPFNTAASVTYDLGAVQAIDAAALWNEESAGIGTLNLLTSTDGVAFSAWGAANLIPTNNPIGLDYFADVFEQGAVNARYIRFDMSDCPQQPAGAGVFNGCAIGEVAFRTADGIAVPEPGVVMLLIAGLLGLAARGSEKARTYRRRVASIR
jgi:hypothetical protein